MVIEHLKFYVRIIPNGKIIKLYKEMIDNLYKFDKLHNLWYN